MNALWTALAWLVWAVVIIMGVGFVGGVVFLVTAAVAGRRERRRVQRYAARFRHPSGRPWGRP